MLKPDFGAYSETQLRQALRRVDATRYPERVQEIEARLAALPVPVQIIQPVTIAGRWRRLGAFCIDMLILGVIGVTAGALFHAQFAAMGAWGRGVGFLIALAYFGGMESRAGGGSSVGKLICNLRVVGRDGALLAPRAALTRTAIFCLAYFLNGASIGGTTENQWALLCQSCVILGLVLGLFYLLVFNRRTRQSIHDLAVGAFVVHGRAGVFAPPARPVWRGHFAIMGVALAAVFAGELLWIHHMPMTSLLAAYRAVSAVPDINRVSITDGTVWSGQSTQQHVIINGVIDESLGDPDALATRIANLALDIAPEMQTRQQIVVVLSSGYDIGIASSWRRTTYAWAPAQWRARAIKPHA